MEVNQYKGIKKAALGIAYDNGIINRYNTEKQFLMSLDPILGAEGVYHKDLMVISNVLLGLSEHNLNVLCTGSIDEYNDELKEHPMFDKLNGLLNDIFEQ